MLRWEGFCWIKLKRAIELISLEWGHGTVIIKLLKKTNYWVMPRWSYEQCWGNECTGNLTEGPQYLQNINPVKRQCLWWWAKLCSHFRLINSTCMNPVPPAQECCCSKGTCSSLWAFLPSLHNALSLWGSLASIHLDFDSRQMFYVAENLVPDITYSAALAY